MKGKALRRALSSDPVRVNADLPAISDTTELITPEIAREMLRHNRGNRPINWRKVEEYSDLMATGQWRMHGQGIMLDVEGNVITGQKRLWAVIYADCAVAMRVSRGNPVDVAHVVDRGTSQTARDLASRHSGRKHSPVESSLARGVLAARGESRPSPDAIAAVLASHGPLFQRIVQATKGTKKTKALLMLLSAVCLRDRPEVETEAAARAVIVREQEVALWLDPLSPEACWGKGAAFTLAMQRVCSEVM